MATDVEREKRLAGEAAADMAESGMTVGLGTGSTSDVLRPGARRTPPRHPLRRDVARDGAAGPRPRPRRRRFEGPDAPARLDLAVDGADQVAADGWVVKGGGGAHTREKLVAVAADRFVVIVSSDKLVEQIAAPIPLELLSFGLGGTLARLGSVSLRGGAPPTPDGGVLADWTGAVDDPAELARQLEATPGVVEHGLFPPEMVTEVVVGRGNAVERL